MIEKLKEFLEEKINDCIESLKDVPDQNSCMAGSYQGEIDGYRNVMDWINEEENK